MGGNLNSLDSLNCMAASSLHETLLSACRTGTEPRAKEALQRGVSTDIRDEAGNSPLMLASQEGHCSVVKLLLSKSASVDTLNKDGNTALLLAILGDKLPVVELLLAAGASVNRCRPDGMNALMLAAIQGNIDVVKACLRSAGSVFIKNAEGSTAFMLSIIHSRMSVVSALLEAGANVNDANHHGYTALMYASQRGNYGAAEFLLSRGANCDDRNNVRHPAIAFSPFPIKDVMILQLGDTALDLARREGHTSIVELLGRYMSTPTLSGTSSSKESELKQTKRKLKIAEREVVRLQRLLAHAAADKDAAIAAVRTELDALRKSLEEAQAATVSAVSAKEVVVQTLDGERKDWRQHIARIQDEKELAVALAERAKREAFAARDAAFVARDNTVVDCLARVKQVESERDQAVQAANAERDAAILARDKAMTLQRQAECMNSSLLAERDRAVDGWARAEAQLKIDGKSLPVTSHHHVLSSDAVMRRGLHPSDSAMSDTALYPHHIRSFTGLSQASDPAPASRSSSTAVISDPETPSAPRTPFAPDVPTTSLTKDPSELVSALVKRSSEDSSERWSGLQYVLTLPTGVKEQLSTALLPAAVWPVRPAVLLDGDASAGCWLDGKTPIVDALPTQAALANLLHNIVFDVVGPTITVGDARDVSHIGAVRPVSVEIVKHSGKLAVGHDSPPNTHAVSFIIATGSSVLVLRGCIPVVPSSGLVLTDAQFVELVIGLSLHETAPHPNIIAAVHSFVGSSTLVRPWVDAAVSVPPHITYGVWPHYPLSLHALITARSSSHRAALLTETEVLVILTQVLSALIHLLDHGFVHRNVTLHSLRFDCRRFQSAVLPPLPVSTESVGEWSGVEVGIHSPIILCDLHHCKRVVQTSGLDYIFGHAITLKDMLAKNDVFALGYCMYNALLGDSAMAAGFPDVSAAAFREWDLPELPAHISKPTKALLVRMVACDPTRRPTLRDAFLRCQAILWSSVGKCARTMAAEPDVTAFASTAEADHWLTNRRLELGFGQCSEMTPLQNALYTEFLLAVSAADLVTHA